MDKTDWIRCPKCGSKTRTMIREHTILEDFPLFCPKCRYTCVIRFMDGKLEEIKQPDAKTQSNRRPCNETEDKDGLTSPTYGSGDRAGLLRSLRQPSEPDQRQMKRTARKLAKGAEHAICQLDQMVDDFVEKHMEG